MAGRKDNGQFTTGNPGRPVGSENKLSTRAKWYLHRVFNEIDALPEEAVLHPDNRDLIDKAIRLIPQRIKNDTKIRVEANPLVDAINKILTPDKGPKKKSS